LPNRSIFGKKREREEDEYADAAVPRLCAELQREPAMQADVFGGLLGVFHRRLCEWVLRQPRVKSGAEFFLERESFIDGDGRVMAGRPADQRVHQ